MTSGSLYFKLLKEDFRRRLWAIALVFLAFFFTLPIGLALNMENAANTNYYRYNDYEPFIQDAAMTDLQYNTRLLKLKTGGIKWCGIRERHDCLFDDNRGSGHRRIQLCLSA